MPWTILLSLFAGALAFYYYFIRCLSYFKKSGIPYVPPLPIVGNMGSILIRRKALAEVIATAYNFHPTAKYIGFFDLQTPVVVIRDPELIKSVAVKNFDNFPNHRGFVDEAEPLFGKNLFALKDDKWRDARSILSPAFTSSKMKSMFKLMSKCSKDFADYLADLPADQDVMEMKNAFARYTTDIIASCAFGISVDSMRNPTNDFYTLGKKLSSINFYQMLKMLISRGFPKLSRKLGIELFDQKVGKFFKNIVEETIRNRDENGISRPDMIQLMMDTRGKEKGKEMTIDDMTAQAFIFFFGGFDTTSSTMGFIAYELALNPDVQERLQREIDTVLEETNGELTYEAINSMKYLDAVINESMRLWPLGVFMDRLCFKSFELPQSLPGLKPFIVEKGNSVWFPTFGLHRDPQYFENPTTFNPDRFLGENGDNFAAFIPFGLGPRMCIGNRFALLEMKVLFFHLLAKCDLKICPKTSIPMVLDKSGFSMTAEGGLWLQVVARNK